MIKLTKKQANALADALYNAGRLEELKRSEGYISSRKLNERRELLRDKIEASLEKLEGVNLGEVDDKTDENVIVKITVNGEDVDEGRRDKKSLQTRFTELFGKKTIEFDDDDEGEGLAIIRKTLNFGTLIGRPTVGKIVKEV